MASEEARKKWGTIFMGEREASVEQLKAMRESADRDRIQKEQSEDYMERVKTRAVERAREILGAAYTERQNVLDEARGEAAAQKRLAAQECARIRSEGEAIRKQAEAELEAAKAEKEEAIRIREAAHAEGYEAGVNQAGAELHEFRAELGQSLASLLRAIERQQKNILENWRDDLVELVKVVARAGTGLVLQQEHEAVLRQLVFQSLDLLENRGQILARVNPEDEETVSDLFRAARERVPELRQWTVTGDESIERGGMIVDSGVGSVDFRRANFREMVEDVLMHLGLPEQERELRASQDVASLVEREVAHIASLTPELVGDEPLPAPAGEDAPVGEDAAPEAEQQEAAAAEAEAPEAPGTSGPAEEIAAAPRPISEELAEIEEDFERDQGIAAPEPEAAKPDESLQDLEEELFPLEQEKTELDAKTLAEGGFL